MSNIGKHCNKCDAPLIMGENYSQSLLNYRKWICKPCVATKQRNLAAKDRARYNEKAKGPNKAWREANREKAKASVQRWREANPEKVKAYSKRWRDRMKALTDDPRPEA
jgi:hypothetical protein